MLVFRIISILFVTILTVKLGTIESRLKMLHSAKKLSEKKFEYGGSRSTQLGFHPLTEQYDELFSKEKAIAKAESAKSFYTKLISKAAILFTLIEVASYALTVS